jgi:hypothetical protein
MNAAETKARFQSLLTAMLTKAPKPVEKSAKARPSSARAPSANYSGTRTRQGKSASASSKSKRGSP